MSKTRLSDQFRGLIFAWFEEELQDEFGRPVQDHDLEMQCYTSIHLNGHTVKCHSSDQSFLVECRTSELVLVKPSLWVTVHADGHDGMVLFMIGHLYQFPGQPSLEQFFADPDRIAIRQEAQRAFPIRHYQGDEIQWKYFDLVFWVLFFKIFFSRSCRLTFF